MAMRDWRAFLVDGPPLMECPIWSDVKLKKSSIDGKQYLDYL
jgi:hypothetical protein